MARRSAAQTHTAAHYAPTGRYPVYELDSDETPYQRFIREQILSPQYLGGNINIVLSMTLFLGGVFAVRSWGEILVIA